MSKIDLKSFTHPNNLRYTKELSSGCLLAVYSIGASRNTESILVLWKNKTLALDSNKPDAYERGYLKHIYCKNWAFNSCAYCSIENLLYWYQGSVRCPEEEWSRAICLAIRFMSSLGYNNMPAHVVGVLTTGDIRHQTVGTWEHAMCGGFPSSKILEKIPNPVHSGLPTLFRWTPGTEEDINMYFDSIKKEKEENAKHTSTSEQVAFVPEKESD